MSGKALTYIAICVLLVCTAQIAKGQPDSMMSRRNLDEETLQRAIHDPAIAALIERAWKEGARELKTPMEVTLKNGHHLSVAILSEGSPAIYLMTADREFRGEAFLLQMQEKEIRFISNEGSFRIDSLFHVGEFHTIDSGFVHCMDTCVMHAPIEDLLGFVVYCSACMAAPSWATCLTCACWWGDQIIDCWIECRDLLPPWVKVTGEVVQRRNEQIGRIINIGPQPFNPVTHITFQLQAAGDVSIRVYDLLGREIATLVNGWVESGTHQATFDGSRYPSGLYLCVLKTPSTVETRRMLLIK